MNLFKRLILSLFPYEITNNAVNPAHMFVSFISTKDFFSIINRKIVEHYKTNLFDISLEPLEAQIGRNNKKKLNKQEKNNYYAYCSVANINGYTFYNVSNISCCMTLASTILIKKSFEQYNEKLFTHFLFTLYLIPYIFATGVKKFPYSEKKENYNWLVELTLNFFEASIPKKYKSQIKKIKEEIFAHPSVFFILFEILLIVKDSLLLNPEYSKKDNDMTILSWITEGEKYKPTPYTSKFSEDELKLLNKIFPNDILPKYLFSDTDSFLVSDKIIGEIYDEKTIKNLITDIKNNNKSIQEFIGYITDPQLFKKGFFKGGKKYISEFFYKNKESNIVYDIEEIISEIGEGIEKIEIPERVKQESKIMEKLLNFYITLLAGFSSAKSDSFYIRIQHPDLTNEITQNLNSKRVLERNFRGNYYNLYATNSEYYKHVYEGIKQNKKQIKFNFSTTKYPLIPKGHIALFQENFVNTLLQEINPRGTKLYIKNAVLIKEFKNQFGEKINNGLKKENKTIIKFAYQDIANVLSHPEILLHPLQKNLNKQDIFNLKEQFYTIDFWIRRELLQMLQPNILDKYDDNSIIAITAIMRETLFGILLLIHYLHNNHYTHITEKILIIYTERILGIVPETAKKIREIIDILKTKYSNLLHLRIHLDDNKEYLDIILKKIQILEKQEEIQELSYENILWIKGVLQTISMYNKRNLLPK